MQQKSKLEELLEAFHKATEFLILHDVHLSNELFQCFEQLLDFLMSPAIKPLKLNKKKVKKLKILTNKVYSAKENCQPLISKQQSKPVNLKEENNVKIRLSSLNSDDSALENSNVTDEEPLGIECINILPNKADLLEEWDNNLSRNIIGEPFPDLNTYIDTHFRLFLEDVMQPLKKGIASIRSGINGRTPEVRLYENARFQKGGMVFDEHAIPDCESAWRCYRITFQSPNNVNWEQSKRLIHGSLVCLWDGGDEFITGITTTQSSPQSLANGEIVIAFGSSEIADNYLSKTYVMIESVVFFEPFRVVLEVLRSFTPETFPFTDYVLGHVTKQQPPRYLLNSKTPYKLMDTKNKQSFTVQNPLELNSWPSAQEMGFDEKQRISLITALTSQVSLVQGPPGTGKTFIALQIVKTLLENASLWQPTFSSCEEYRRLSAGVTRPGDNSRKVNKKFLWKRIGPKWHDPRAPVLVVCLTNHALDQFLGEVLQWTDKVIRIGARSQSEIMEKYNLSAIKNNFNFREHEESNYPYYVMEMQAMRKSMKEKLNQLKRETSFLKTELPTIENLKQRGVIGNDVVSYFVKQKCKGDQKQDGSSKDPLKQWLCWDNHNLMKRIARESRLNLSSIVSGKRRESEKREKKLKEILKGKKTGREVLTDASEIVEDLSDEHFDDDTSSSGVESSETEEEPDEQPFEEDDIFGDAEDLQFKADQKYQLEEMRAHLCKLSAPESCLTVNAKQMGSLPVKKRWQLFSHWRRCYREAVRGSLKRLEENYKKDITKYKELKGQSLAALCRGASVVGMTTTGAAKNRKMLEALRCKIVLVEEAAEVLESHVISSLTADCQQLIMIGDHQQLRPSVHIRELQTKYQLDVSLFERLVKVGMEPSVLGVQHRMRPEIARLITPTIYTDLKNADIVHGRPNIPGLLHDVFFLHHEHAQERDGLSYFNQHEVEMALGLAAYLVRQGLAEEKITILTTYSSQMYKLQDTRRRRFNTLRNVRITVVDNFQGEENEVIILSLVRNNTQSSIGFLATPNRVCVALSRARRGFYMLGNMQLLSRASPLWAQINEILSENGQIGSGFPLCCTRHKNNRNLVANLDGFRTKEKFCQVKCGFVMQCGHPCPLKCHDGDAHEKPCSQILKTILKCGHVQTELCAGRKSPQKLCIELVKTNGLCGHTRMIPCHLSDASPCDVIVRKSLPCGHVVEAACHLPAKTIPCPVEVRVRFSCSHTALVPCDLRTKNQRTKTSDYQCKELVMKNFSCGHSNRIPCFQKPKNATCSEPATVSFGCGHTIESICGRRGNASCHQPIERELPCGHKTAVPCGYFAEDVECETRVSFDLPCGHQTVVECCRRNEDHKCMALVSKLLPCNHSKGLPCYKDVTDENCDECAEILKQTECFHSTSGQCTEMVTKKLLCGHAMEIPCYRNPFTELCKQLVVCKLDCGHKYSGICGETSNEEKLKCSENVKIYLPCGHTVKTECHKSKASFTCNEKVELRLKCGHTVSAQCSSSNDVKCDKKLKRELTCRHVVEVPCGSIEATKPIKTIFCRERVKKRAPGCGHETETECGRNPSRKQCESKCKKSLKCGHLCQLKCKDVCDSVPCKEMIDLSTVKRPCGHVPQGPCHLRYADESKRNSWMRKSNRCTSTCGAKLDCGHSCPGICSECVASHSHAVCDAPCNRTLVCGHKCEAKCSVACPPCKKRCTYRCAHNLCNKLCCDDCRVCKKPCAWKCPHMTCNHPCDELCSREPCNNPCTRTLGCGHACIGLCGELCPPKCPRCSGTTIENFHKNHRYIYLECGDWIEVKRMDNWVFEQRELGAEKDLSASKLIQAPSCPDCKKPVVNCFRYGDVIKNYYFDLPSIKYQFVHDVPNDGNATMKALKSFLEDRNLAAIHSLLSKFIQEIENMRKGSREQLWDRANRTSLMYEWCCLLSDVKKMYTFCVRGKKYQLQLEKSDTELFFNTGLPSIKKIVECHSCGPEFCSNLSDRCTRLDYVRQILVVKAASLVCNVFKSAQLTQAIELSGNWEHLDDGKFEFLDTWLGGILQDYGLKLQSSVRPSRALTPRLSTCEGVWKKCSYEACGDVFSTIRCEECPSC